MFAAGDGGHEGLLIGQVSQTDQLGDGRFGVGHQLAGLSGGLILGLSFFEGGGLLGGLGLGLAQPAAQHLHRRGGVGVGHVVVDLQGL